MMNVKGRQARTRLPTAVAAAALAVVVLAGGLAAAAARGPAGARIAAADAARHAGEEATVCGLVASAKHAARSKGQPTFLDFDKPYPAEVFKVVIWGADRSKFKEPPERLYLQKDVCVTGPIRLYRGAPEIVVRDPAQLTIESASRE